MPFLSPAKVLVILVVALIVLGPDKLPKMARQLGALWGDFRKFRQRLESEVRGNFPDLPSTERISQAVRSPISFLDNLADTHASPSAPEATPGATVALAETTPADAADAAAHGDDPPRHPEIRSISITDGDGVLHQVRSNGRTVPDDPGMN